MNANEILKVLREEYNKEGSRFTVFGLRGEDREMKVGDNCNLSMQEMDDVEPYELDGTCAVGFGYLSLDESDEESDLEAIENAIKTAEKYRYSHYYVVAGTSSEYGVDDDEIIISDYNDGAAVIYAIR